MFPEIKHNFGFGCMRLPMTGEKVDEEEFKKMVDLFIAQGFNYFDTAHGYLNGESEKAIKTCLTDRYPREAYILTDKLTEPFFHSEEEIRPFFESQLEILGVEYLDFYLMHAQNARNFEHFKKCRAYETAFELKKEGKIRHVGLSFHDSPEVLDRILSTYPEIEVVQIQYNYLDVEDATVQSQACYEVVRKHGKPLIIMEPVKGGTLSKMPSRAAAILENLNGGSPASYALRFAAMQPGVAMVLSGMGSTEMVRENTGLLKEVQPLNEAEMEAVKKVREYFQSQDLIGCTACCYCTEGCPKQIFIPEIFKAMNENRSMNIWDSRVLYNKAVENRGTPDQCIGCKACERICPQSLPITDLLQEAAEIF